MMGQLSGYFERIGYTGEPRTDLATLEKLHFAHPLAIPFENVSTLLGEPVPIDLGSIMAKLVAQGRGGYCFEHNTLFQAVLEAIGFAVTALAARVVWSEDAGHVNPRTHMVLLVRLDGRDWICDVGFGGATLTAPLELIPEREQPTRHETFRLLRDDGEFELQVRWAGRWRPMYRFDLQPQLPVDFEALNHYVATYPLSHFRTTLMAGRALADRRLALVRNRFVVLREGRPESERVLNTAAEIRDLLTGEFGITLKETPDLERRLGQVASGEPVPDPAG